MTLISGRRGGPQPADLTPIVARFITYAPHDVATVEHTTIAVPESFCTQVRLFQAPGCNYSVQMAFGYNGARQIPTMHDSDYVIAPGKVETYPWGFPVAGDIDVWALCWNSNPHTIWVAFDLDYRPLIASADVITRTVAL